MYLHLGQDVVVKLEDIIGIFDMENSTIEKSTKNYLAKAQKENRVINVSLEMPKSFIVCKKPSKYFNKSKKARTNVNNEKNENEIVYISQISSQTLKKRTGFIENISNVNI